MVLGPAGSDVCRLRSVDSWRIRDSSWVANGDDGEFRSRLRATGAPGRGQQARSRATGRQERERHVVVRITERPA